MQVTLLGTGDTTGTPTPGCDCGTCRRAADPDDALVERLGERGVDATGGVERSRFSVHVRNEHTGESLLVDTSPDLRSQFLDRGVGEGDAVVEKLRAEVGAGVDQQRLAGTLVADVH